MASPVGSNTINNGTGLWILIKIRRKLANGGHSIYCHIVGWNLNLLFKMTMSSISFKLYEVVLVSP